MKVNKRIFPPFGDREDTVAGFSKRLLAGDILTTENMSALDDAYRADNASFAGVLISALCDCMEYIRLKGPIKFYDENGGIQTINSYNFKEFVDKRFPRYYDDVLRKHDKKPAGYLYTTMNYKDFLLKDNWDRVQDVRSLQDIQVFFDKMQAAKYNHIFITARQPIRNVERLYVERFPDCIRVSFKVWNESETIFYDLDCSPEEAWEVIQSFYDRTLEPELFTNTK